MRGLSLARLVSCASWAAWLALAAVPALGCGHAAASMDGVLRKGDVTVRLGSVPSGWSPIAVEGADAAYRDEGHQGSVLFDLRCHERDGDAPLASLTAHLVMGTTAREIQVEETIPFDGREALHTVMRAKLDGVALQYDLYVMKKDGCVYDLVYVAPEARFQEGAAAFDAFARGLHAESGR